MSQVQAPIRWVRQLARLHWRGLTVAGALLLVFSCIALSMLNHETWQAERRYRAAVAEADRLAAAGKLASQQPEAASDDEQSPPQQMSLF